jgi:hypothetical protein
MPEGDMIQNPPDAATLARLKCAYDQASEIIGPGAECFDVAELVERIRWRWRPDKVRVVLLAESHGWTSRDEMKSRVRQPDGTETCFARFVYCLGCGEPQLVSPCVERNRTNISLQFWKLLHDTVCGPTVPYTWLTEKNCQERVGNKFDLLRKMRAAGVWLVDASITALFRKLEKLEKVKKDYRSVLKACWTSHVREVLYGCEPSAVVIVGKDVYDAIGGDVRKALGGSIKIDYIYQPQAHLSKQARDDDRRKCFELCRLAANPCRRC